MKTKEVGGIWMLEESAGLLRAVPARCWSVWLLGTLPYTWALVDFLMEMSRSAFAAERLVNKSLLLVGLYVWKHVAQALFARDCLRLLRGDELVAVRPGEFVRLVLAQTALQPWRFVLLPLASLLFVPVPLAMAFFRNAGISALERERGAVGEAWRLARSDARGHGMAIGILSLAWLLLFVNLLVLWFVTPMLLKSFFGWQNEFTRLGSRALNLTTVLTTCILTSVALEPVYCAMAAVRAFFAQARTGGEDLRGVLRRMAVAACLLLLVPMMPLATVVHAQEKRVDRELLDQRIEQVLHEREFSWRLPREQSKAPERSWLDGLFDGLERWVREVSEFIRKIWPKETPAAALPSGNLGVNPALLRWAMIAAGLLAAGAMVLILFSRRKDRAAKPLTAAVVAAALDLADENLSAEQQPEEEWLRLAFACADRGEYRLGMRAIHLAGLRYLGEKGWVLLQPAKTGLEYGRELARRLRDRPEALGTFGEGLREYELVWYGFGAAGPAEFAALRERWEALRRHA